MLLLSLVPGWYFGVPLARAWHDVTVMTSLPSGRQAQGNGASMRVVRLTAAQLESANRMLGRTDGAPAALDGLARPGGNELTSASITETTELVKPPADEAASPTLTETVELAEPPVEASPVVPLTETAEIPAPEITELPAAVPPETSTMVLAEPVAPEITELPVAVAPEAPPTATVELAPAEGTELPVVTELPAAVEPVSSTTVATELPTVAPPPEATSALTVLVLGIDARPHEGALGRSDVIMVARLDPARQRVALLSLPRDLWVTIPYFGQGKINSAYFLGELTGEGAAVAKETVSNALGIPIDYTAVVDFNGFRGLIDTLEGVPVDVPRELHDPRYPTEDYGYTVAHFTPGTEVMNGERALMYSRIRHPDSDFERLRRQQAVVVGVGRKLRERGIMRNLAEADKLTGAVKSYVRTDLPPATGLSLLWTLRNLDPGAVERITADTSQLREINAGSYAVIADPSVLHSLGAKLVGAP